MEAGNNTSILDFVCDNDNHDIKNPDSPINIKKNGRSKNKEWVKLQYSDIEALTDQIDKRQVYIGSVKKTTYGKIYNYSCKYDNCKVCYRFKEFQILMLMSLNEWQVSTEKHNHQFDNSISTIPPPQCNKIKEPSAETLQRKARRGKARSEDALNKVSPFKLFANT